MAETAALPAPGRPLERVVVSVPGKLILMGEHAAVYGRPALVAALGLRSRVTLERLEGTGVELDLMSLERREQTGWEEIRDYAEQKLRQWRLYVEDPSNRSFDAVVGQDPIHLVRVALGEAARELGSSRPPSVRLEVSSEIPLRSGFGSSASVAVGVVRAMFGLVGEPADFSRVGRAVLEVERRQHGQPSGVDHTTVMMGGLLRLEREERGLSTAALEADRGTLEKLRVLHTGFPEESTGEVVASVGARRERNHQTFEKLLDRMEMTTRGFWEVLSKGAGDTEQISRLISSYQRCLEAIGVVPDAVKAAIRRIESAGGAAKISGAGALSPGGAGALLVFWPFQSVGELKDLIDGFVSYEAEIGAPGMRVEETS